MSGKLVPGMRNPESMRSPYRATFMSTRTPLGRWGSVFWGYNGQGLWRPFLFTSKLPVNRGKHIYSYQSVLK